MAPEPRGTIAFLVLKRPPMTPEAVSFFSVLLEKVDDLSKVDPFFTAYKAAIAGFENSSKPLDHGGSLASNPTGTEKTFAQACSHSSQSEELYFSLS